MNLELDCRVGCAVEWPVDLAQFACDENAAAQAAYASGSPTSPPGYWCPILPYLLWQQLPPGTRVLCGIEVPDFSGNVTLARQAAARINLGYNENDTAEQICAAIVAWHGGQ